MMKIDIVTLIKAGDEKGLDHAYSLYSLPLLRFINSYLMDYNLSKDVLQDVFIALWTARTSFADDTAIDKLLFTIAKNKSLNAIRSNKNRSKHIVGENCLSELQIAAISNYKVCSVDEQSLLEQLEALYGDLPENHKQVFNMNRIDGLTYNEIARNLSISPKTVEKRVSTVLKVMREKSKKIFFFVVIVGIILLCGVI